VLVLKWRFLAAPSGFLTISLHFVIFREKARKKRFEVGVFCAFGGFFVRENVSFCVRAADDWAMVEEISGLDRSAMRVSDYETNPND
jgi:hypothetical protein